jgi:hypothetical protein
MTVNKLENVGCALHLSPRAGTGRIALAIRVRGALRKRGGNGFKHARNIAEHVVIPKPQNSIVVIGEPFVANRVVRIVRMLSSINFNDETSFAANKIDRIRTDRLLSDKLVSVQSARPKLVPQCGLGFRCVLPQPPGPLGFDITGSTHVETPPHPDCFAIRPLPARGERLALRAFT